MSMGLRKGGVNVFGGWGEFFLNEPSGTLFRGTSVSQWKAPMTMSVNRGCRGIEVRNFSQFSEIAQFFAIFRKFFFCNFLTCPSYVPVAPCCQW